MPVGGTTWNIMNVEQFLNPRVRRVKDLHFVNFVPLAESKGAKVNNLLFYDIIGHLTWTIWDISTSPTTLLPLLILPGALMYKVHQMFWCVHDTPSKRILCLSSCQSVCRFCLSLAACRCQNRRRDTFYFIYLFLKENDGQTTREN